MSSFRNANYDIFLAFELISFKFSIQDIQTTIAEQFIGRFNYLQTLSRVMYVVTNTGIENSSIYLNNIIGLIPRVIWPDKPFISDYGIDTGATLEMINAFDFKSSLGLGVSGEAFYRLGYFGLIVALFEANFFAFFTKNFNFKKNLTAQTLFIFYTIKLLSRDGYFAILPGLIWDSLSCFLFLGIIIVFNKPRKSFK
tara:strand:- start:466 stop:1056 length:591 start_codon:yes stop_codon:yes gene_type:complete